MSVRRQRNQVSHWHWINRGRFYNYDTLNSDMRKKNGERVQLRQSSFKAAAVRFDKQFSETSDKFVEYNVTRKDGKYIVTIKRNG